LGTLKRSDLVIVAGATVIIVLAIVITALVQGAQDNSFSKVITVGPIWNNDAWACTSDADFVVLGALRGIGDLPQLSIAISGVGTQSFYVLEVGALETINVGAAADRTVLITRTGTVSGFITLQTASDATASCSNIP